MGIPTLEPVIVPAVDPLIVPVLDPVIVPLREPVIVPLVRDPGIVPADETVASDKVNSVAIEIR